MTRFCWTPRPCHHRPSSAAPGADSRFDHGGNKLALKMALAAERYYSDNTRIGELKIESADQLRSENQFLNPFKYTRLLGNHRGGGAPPPEPLVRILVNTSSTYTWRVSIHVYSRNSLPFHGRNACDAIGSERSGPPWSSRGRRVILATTWKDRPSGSPETVSATAYLLDEVVRCVRGEREDVSRTSATLRGGATGPKCPFPHRWRNLLAHA